MKALILSFESCTTALAITLIFKLHIFLMLTAMHLFLLHSFPVSQVSKPSITQHIFIQGDTRKTL